MSAKPVAVGVPIAVTSQFSDGICACFNNIPICLAGCCCSCITTGQLYERVVKKGTFQLIALVVGCLIFAGSVFETNCRPIIMAAQNPQLDSGSYNPDTQSTCLALASTMSLVSFVAFVIVGYVTCTVRQKVRAASSISPTCCGPCDDCLCGFFCPCLNQTQLLRHLGVVENTKYSVCAPDGIAV